MSDLISRQAALDAVNDCGICIQKILDLPSAEPKKGKWTIETIGEIPRYRDSPIYEPIYKCSCCGMTTESYVRFEEPIMPEDADFPRYCPNCGVKMSEIPTDSESEDKE